ncbi:MAG: PH domain-containing protein [Promethearchaeota archaeon]
MTEPLMVIKPKIVSILLFIKLIPIALFLALIAGIFGFMLSILAIWGTGQASIADFILPIVIICSLLAILYVFATGYFYKKGLSRTEYRIYPTKLEYIEGYSTIIEKSIKWQNVVEVYLAQGASSRKYNMGYLEIFTATEGKVEGKKLEYIENPEEVYNLVLELTDNKPDEIDEEPLMTLKPHISVFSGYGMPLSHMFAFALWFFPIFSSFMLFILFLLTGFPYFFESAFTPLLIVLIYVIYRMYNNVRTATRTEYRIYPHKVEYFERYGVTELKSFNFGRITEVAVNVSFRQKLRGTGSLFLGTSAISSKLWTRRTGLLLKNIPNALEIYSEFKKIVYENGWTPQTGEKQRYEVEEPQLVLNSRFLFNLEMLRYGIVYLLLGGWLTIGFFVGAIQILLTGLIVEFSILFLIIGSIPMLFFISRFIHRKNLNNSTYKFYSTTQEFYRHYFSISAYFIHYKDIVKVQLNEDLLYDQILGVGDIYLLSSTRPPKNQRISTVGKIIHNIPSARENYERIKALVISKTKGKTVVLKKKDEFIGDEQKLKTCVSCGTDIKRNELFCPQCKVLVSPKTPLKPLKEEFKEPLIVKPKFRLWDVFSSRSGMSSVIISFILSFVFFINFGFAVSIDPLTGIILIAILIYIGLIIFLAITTFSRYSQRSYNIYQKYIEEEDPIWNKKIKSVRYNDVRGLILKRSFPFINQGYGKIRILSRIKKAHFNTLNLSGVGEVYTLVKSLIFSEREIHLVDDEPLLTISPRFKLINRGIGSFLRGLILAIVPGCPILFVLYLILQDLSYFLWLSLLQFVIISALIIMLCLTILDYLKDKLHYQKTVFHIYQTHAEVFSGILSFNESIVPFVDVKEVSLSKNILQRRYDLGTIILDTEAASTKFFDVKDPDTTYMRIKKLVESAKNT